MTSEISSGSRLEQYLSSRNGSESSQSQTPEQSPYPPSVDYSAVMAYMSDQSKTTALAQILSNEMALQQNSIDRHIQAAANLELEHRKVYPVRVEAI